MAEAKKCDRCGEYYRLVEPNPFDELSRVLSQMTTPRPVLAQISVIEKFLDLCPSCSKSLKQWVRCKEVKEDAK